MDRFDLYELCVQSPGDLVPLLRAIHGRSSRVLGEDFAGTAALSRAWAQANPEHRAIAVDHDGATLVLRPGHDRVQRIVGDVRTATDPDSHRCDIIDVGNFSIGQLHTRGDLVDYLRCARVGPGGVFICDTYAGESAFQTGRVHRDHVCPDGIHVRYSWEQREADPLTGMVANALQFRLMRGGVVQEEINDAFVYRWRLWSVPELRDAMSEAGLPATSVYAKLPSAIDTEGNAYMAPVTDPDDLDDSFIVYVAGRTG